MNSILDFITVGLSIAALLIAIYLYIIKPKPVKADSKQPELIYYYTHGTFRGMYEHQGEFPLVEDDAPGRFVLLSKEGLEIPPGRTQTVGTGVMFDIPKGYELLITPRGGMTVTHSISILNTPGRIDSNYTGEIKVVLHNHGRNSYRLKPGNRIADVALVPVPTMPKLEEGIFDDQD